ncbi:unnamed protein product [Spirodela intermedia]|uniref:Uncharacterized protein n=1 Tax=Spirodela intermedia TaxID=51605 RepID=A0A7I8KXR6_SPIIN|nr:unnamed protein product [Spirodela intermedia]
MGVLGNIVDALGFKEKCTTLNTVKVRVKMDCEGCEKKVYRGQWAEVTGYVEAEEVLRKLKFSGKKAEIWPFVPANLVPYPYAPGAYDRKAPPGFVRNTNAAFLPGPVYKQSQAISAAFSDENPNACSIM